MGVKAPILPRSFALLAVAPRRKFLSTAIIYLLLTISHFIGAKPSPKSTDQLSIDRWVCVITLLHVKSTAACIVRCTRQCAQSKVNHFHWILTLIHVISIRQIKRTLVQ